MSADSPIKYHRQQEKKGQTNYWQNQKKEKKFGQTETNNVHRIWIGKALNTWYGHKNTSHFYWKLNVLVAENSPGNGDEPRSRTQCLNFSGHKFHSLKHGETAIYTINWMSRVSGAWNIYDVIQYLRWFWVDKHSVCSHALSTRTIRFLYCDIICDKALNDLKLNKINKYISIARL